MKECVEVNEIYFAVFSSAALSAALPAEIEERAT